MENEYEENIDSNQNNEEIKDESDNSNETESLKERIAQLEKDNETLSFQKKRWREKAQSKIDNVDENDEEVKQPVKSNNSETFSIKDTIALSKASLEEEDLEYVLKYSKMENKSVAEVLKDKDVQAVLDKRNEYRQSEKASHTGNYRAEKSTLTDDAFLKKYSNGNFPDNDEDMRRLVKLKN